MGWRDTHGAVAACRHVQEQPGLAVNTIIPLDYEIETTDAHGITRHHEAIVLLCAYCADSLLMKLIKSDILPALGKKLLK